jgi:hypothetical protein
MAGAQVTTDTRYDLIDLESEKRYDPASAALSRGENAFPGEGEELGSNLL